MTQEFFLNGKSYRLEELQEINHFYYCLIVAMTLRQNMGDLSVTIEKRFMRDWLMNAKKHKLFSKVVAEDISWLINNTENKRVRYISIINSIREVYIISRSLITDKNINQETAKVSSGEISGISYST